MKRLLSSWTLLCVLFQLWAQIPAGYYEFATGTHGSGLKTALFSIITEHTERSYKELWTDMQKTDVREDGRGYVFFQLRLHLHRRPMRNL